MRQKKYNTSKGLTLIEIIVSLALLSIIIIPFLAMFVNSTKVNSRSDTTLNATYLAQVTMEELYHFSESYTFMDGLIQLGDNGFTQTTIIVGNDYDFGKEQGPHYIKIEIRKSAYSGNLTKTLVKIYNNSAMDILQAQMETILSWKD